MLDIVTNIEQAGSEQTFHVKTRHYTMLLCKLRRETTGGKRVHAKHWKNLQMEQAWID